MSLSDYRYKTWLNVGNVEIPFAVTRHEVSRKYRYETTYLMLERGIRSLQNIEEDLLEEHLDLHLQVHLEIRQQRQKNGQRQFEHLRNGTDAVLRQCDAQILLDGRDEHVVGTKYGTGVLEDGEEELEGEDLGAEFVRFGIGRAFGKGFHGELAEGAEDEEGVFLEDVGEFGCDR